MYEWLIYVSSALIILGYIPEIVQNVKNKNATFDSLPIWIIWILSSVIGIVYCIINKEYTVIINFTITGILNTLVFLIKLYYAYITSRKC
jgi:predicted branched-subunit amino acid permease